MKQLDDMNSYIASEWNDCGGRVKRIGRPDYKRFCNKMLLGLAGVIVNLMLLAFVQN